MRDSVLIPIYRVYRLYDYLCTYLTNGWWKYFSTVVGAYNLAIAEKDNKNVLYNICENHDVLSFSVEAVGFSIRLKIAILSGLAHFSAQGEETHSTINSNTGLGVERAYFLPFW